MVGFPNAKINIGLNIHSKRTDGYHNLQTVFYPINLCDILEVVAPARQTQDELILSGLPIDGKTEDNLVLKAVRALRKEADFPFVQIHLFKNIPFGAGLGGGSADASYTLRLLNEKFCLGKSVNDLAKVAITLGADCPFFLYNKPMYATGIGEDLSPIDLDLKAYQLILVMPHVYVSTRDAFAGIVPEEKPFMLDVLQLSPDLWRDKIGNDFEKTVFTKHPILANIKEKLYQSGALYASMSGSGSVIYGIFPKNVLPQRLPFEYKVINL